MTEEKQEEHFRLGTFIYISCKCCNHNKQCSEQKRNECMPIYSVPRRYWEPTDETKKKIEEAIGNMLVNKSW